MAKRAPIDEKPYRPVDEALVRSVMGGGPPVGEGRNDGNAAVAMLPEVSASMPAARVVMPAMNAEAIPPRIVPEGPRETTQVENRPANDVADYAERRDREKRVLLTRPEERDIERMVAKLATQLGTPMKLSHLLRASITMLLHSEDEIIERAKRVSLTRPGNGNGPELAEFERGVALLLSAAFREARPLR